MPQTCKEMCFLGEWMLPHEEFLTSFVCGSNGGYCHPNVVPFRRTQKAQQAIGPNQRVLVVPRKLQIWDLDALRDDFVQSELSQARHVYTNNPLHSGAFLAAYLARRANLNTDKRSHASLFQCTTHIFHVGITSSGIVVRTTTVLLAATAFLDI